MPIIGAPPRSSGGHGGGDTRFTSDATTPALLDPRAMNGKTFKSELDGGVFHALNAALNARHKALKRTEAPIAYKQTQEVDRFVPEIFVLFCNRNFCERFLLSVNPECWASH